MANCIIRLHDVYCGPGLKSGTDTHGCQWMEFEVDYLADQTDGECNICGKALSSGWTNLDGREEVCDDHVHYDLPQ